MDKQTINIYSDKKFAAIIYVVTLAVSTYFTISIWFDNCSLFIKFSVVLTGLLFFAVASFGIFTLFSKQFKYYGPGTNEYDDNGHLDHPTFLTFDDRLQARLNPKKVIYYKDITSITAIPNAFLVYEWIDEKEDNLFFFTEIKYCIDKKIVLIDEYGIIRSFQRNQNTNIRALPTKNEVEKSFGKTKFIASSFLFKASPIRINIWTKTF